MGGYRIYIFMVLGLAVTGRRVSLWPDTGESAAEPLAAGRVMGIADDLGFRTAWVVEQ